MNDPFDLRRFVEAQNPVYERVCTELRHGRKRSHWIWFVFPQLAGLGRSEMAQRYGIGSLPEATAYLRHPVLGPRLRECARLVNDVDGRAIGEILGSPDDLKFHSSMTLFAHASPDDREFVLALRKYFADRHDPATLARIAAPNGRPAAETRRQE